MGMSHVEILRPNDSQGTRRPTPWRAAERRGNEYIIVDDDGAWAASAPDEQVAGLIVEAVNDYARALGHDFDTGD